jgi:hypothetical protein
MGGGGKDMEKLAPSVLLPAMLKAGSNEPKVIKFKGKKFMVVASAGGTIPRNRKVTKTRGQQTIAAPFCKIKLAVIVSSNQRITVAAVRDADDYTPREH